MRILAVIPASFLAGALAMRALLRFAPIDVSPDLRQAIPVVTNWHAFGLCAAAILFATIAVATLAYFRGLQGEPPPVRVTVAYCAASIAAAWFVPLLFSSDVYAYAAYAEMARLGMDVYIRTTLPGGNAIFAAAIWQWGNPPPACVFGALFVAFARALVALFAPLGVRAQLDGLRALGSLALVACGPLLALACGERRMARYAALAVALNPAAIWSVAEGHNDALMLAVASVGAAIALRANLAPGVCIAAMSALVKIPGALAAIALAAGAPRNRRLSAIVGASLGSVVVAILLVPWAHGLATHASTAGGYALQASMQALFVAIPWGGPVAAALALLGCAMRCAYALRAGDRTGWAWLALGAWLAIPNPYPWYGLWVLPAAILAPATRIGRVVLLLPLAAVLRYLPDALGMPNAATSYVLAAASCLPLTLLLPRSVPTR